MSDLRRELEELKRQVEMLLPNHQAEDYLRAYFDSSEFDGHREAIVAALLSPDPRYSFRTQLEDDPPGSPSTFMIFWWSKDTGAPPHIIRLRRVNNWRSVHGDLPLPPYPHVETDEPPTQAAKALARNSSHLTAREQTVECTPDASARPDLALSAPGGHSERPSELPSEERARIESEIARLKADIARMKPPERQQPPPAQPGASITDVSSPARPHWSQKVF